MLTPEQRSEFDERGFVRLRAVFSRSEAAAMEERLWATLNRKHGVCRNDPGSWVIPPASGLQPLRTHAAFAPIGRPAVFGALDELIGEGCWEEPKHWDSSWSPSRSRRPEPTGRGPSGTPTFRTSCPSTV